MNSTNDKRAALYLDISVKGDDDFEWEKPETTL